MLNIWKMFEMITNFLYRKTTKQFKINLTKSHTVVFIFNSMHEEMPTSFYSLIHIYMVSRTYFIHCMYKWRTLLSYFFSIPIEIFFFRYTCNSFSFLNCIPSFINWIIGNYQEIQISLIPIIWKLWIGKRLKQYTIYLSIH